MPNADAWKTTFSKNGAFPKAMRYFAATPETFDSIRLMVMGDLGQPNDKALQPWPAGISSLALGAHEYEPPAFAALIDYALAHGVTEITEEQYQATHPTPPHP